MSKSVMSLVVGLTCLMGQALASTEALEKHLQITEIETTEESYMIDGSQFTSVMVESALTEEESQKLDVSVTGVGEVIQVARDLVALGEEVYVLVNKGRPNLNTSYAPVSVLPREGERSVNVMDMDGWKLPVSRTVTVEFKNVYGYAIASLEYKLVFNYGGSYNGKGAYITNAQIIPSKAYAFYGVDFDATMRLSGLANHGTRANPVAGAMLHIDYKAKTMFSSVSRADTYHITGNGQVRKL